MTDKNVLPKYSSLRDERSPVIAASHEPDRYCKAKTKLGAIAVDKV